MAGRRHLRTLMESLSFDPGPARETGLGGVLSGRDLRSVERGGSKVGFGRKGKGSTWHQLTDGNGLPLSGLLTGADVHELTKALAVVDGICVPKSSGRGRSRKRPKELAADKGYDSRVFRKELRKRNIQPVIPSREWKGRKRRPGRQPGATTKPRVKNRWKVERLFAWQDQYRRLAVRWERNHQVFEGFLTLCSAMICLNAILR